GTARRESDRDVSWTGASVAPTTGSIRAPRAAPRPATPEHEREAMKKVLVVEDTEMIRTLLTTYLQRFDCDVFEAEDGRVGLAMAGADRPDLVLLDVAMPGMDGREVLEHLRRIRATRDVPVIMVTAISERDVVLSILKVGVTAYLVKPIDRDRF